MLNELVPKLGFSPTLADQNENGVTHFVYGGAYYRPFYSGSSVIYEVVAKPA